MHEHAREEVTDDVDALHVKLVNINTDIIDSGRADLVA
jgi:hypothetical protein